MEKKEGGMRMEWREHCMLCPRECGANRGAGERGVCGESAAVRVGRAALHMWEEPCISGTRGSGAVFFAGCSLRCRFCQNYALSRSGAGREVTTQRLADIFLELEDQGAHNINLVTPTHFVPPILAALERARAAGLRIPIVYNTSGYEKVETLAMLDGYVDIYLPDFKYHDNEYAVRFSGAPDYFERATAALDEMVRQIGTSEIGEDGLMRRGVIVRHLLLPGMLYDTRCVILHLHERYGDNIYISLMNQYTPTEQVKGDSSLYRTLSEGQYARAISYAMDIGVTRGFVQEEGTVSESFIPLFDGTGV